MSGSAVRPQLPPDCRRTHFWDLSHQKIMNDGCSPFERVRAERDLTPYAVAERMNLEFDEYMEIECGDAFASPQQILDFCQAAECHPLDLYDHMGAPIDPLPSPIFESLLRLFAGEEAHDPDPRRTRQAIEMESRRARAMVVANTDFLQPLLMALGYSPDLRRFNAPLSPLVPEGERKTWTPLKHIFAREAGSIRGHMGNCLVALQAQMEDELETHERIGRKMEERHHKSTHQMERMAKDLYGENEKFALRRIRKIIRAVPECDLRNQRVRYYINHPEKVCELTDKAPVNPPARAALLFIAVRSALLVDRAVPGGGAATEIEDAAGRLESYLEWRRLPRTQRLLDWFEHSMILNPGATTLSHARLPQMGWQFPPPPALR